MIDPPAPRPCESCPYRRDAPSGLWAESQYRKLPPYDADTPAQPPEVFVCHTAPRRVCAGWLGCHDTDNLLSLRLATLKGSLAEPVEAFFTYVCPVPLWGSGQATAEHGMRRLADPPAEAVTAMAKIVVARSLAGRPISFPVRATDDGEEDGR